MNGSLGWMLIKSYKIYQLFLTAYENSASGACNVYMANLCCVQGRFREFILAREAKSPLSSIVTPRGKVTAHHLYMVMPNDRMVILNLPRHGKGALF